MLASIPGATIGAVAAFPPPANGKAQRSDDDPPRQVWLYDHRDGWSRCDDPVSCSPGEDYNAALSRARYCLITQWPHEDAAAFLQWYEGDGPEDWLLSFNTPNTWQTIVVADLPSLLDLLGQLLPLVESASRLDDRGDRHEEQLEARRRERAGLPPRKAVRR